MLSLDPFAQERSTGAFAPVYVFVSEQEFERRIWRQRLLTAFAESGGAVSRWDADTCDSEDLRVGLGTADLFSPRRLAIVKLFGKNAIKRFDVLTPIVKDPPTGLTLAFEAESIDKRTSFWKAVQKQRVFEGGKWYEREVRAFIHECAKINDARFTNDVVEAIRIAIGPNLAMLAAEIEKLALYLDGEPATLQAVRDVVSRAATASSFEFADAVFAGKLESALRALDDVFRQGAVGPEIVGALVWKFKQMELARSALDGGTAPREAAVQAGVRPFFADAFVSVLHQVDRRRLEKIHVALLDVDNELKNNRLPEKLALERFVLLLCAPRLAAKA